MNKEMHRTVTRAVEGDNELQLSVDDEYSRFLLNELQRVEQHDEPMIALASFLNTAGPIILCKSVFRVQLYESMISVSWSFYFRLQYLTS